MTTLLAMVAHWPDVASGILLATILTAGGIVPCHTLHVYSQTQLRTAMLCCPELAQR